jgi:hypothetical protein
MYFSSENQHIRPKVRLTEHDTLGEVWLNQNRTFSRPVEPAGSG